MFAPSSDITRAELVYRMRYLKPKTSFRSGYAYDNVLYGVAGQLIYAVTGQTWEDYMRSHVLEPAHMLNSTSDDEHRFADPDRAWPHARLNGPMRGLGDQQVLDERDDLGKSTSPAGGISASAEDMAQWIKIAARPRCDPGRRAALQRGVGASDVDARGDYPDHAARRRRSRLRRRSLRTMRSAGSSATGAATRSSSTTGRCSASAPSSTSSPTRTSALRCSRMPRTARRWSPSATSCSTTISMARRPTGRRPGANTSSIRSTRR